MEKKKPEGAAKAVLIAALLFAVCGIVLLTLSFIIPEFEFGLIPKLGSLASTLAVVLVVLGLSTSGKFTK